MITLYTVIEKSQMLAMLQNDKLPAFINNVRYSQSCCDTIFCTVANGCLELEHLLPCICCDDNEFVEALTERFPINWQTHMYLMLQVDEDAVCHLNHGTLLELSALPEPCTTEETIQYQQLLLSSVENDFSFGVGNKSSHINFVINVKLADVKGYMLLDQDFDPEESTELHMDTNVTAANIQNAIKSSVFDA